MKIKALFLIPLLLILSLPVVAREINGDGDFQLWWHQSYTRSCGKKRHLSLSAEERWGGDASTLYFFFIQTNYSFQFKDWLEIAPGWRQAFPKDLARNRWRTTYEPMLIVNMKRACGKWEFALRHQIQYRIHDHRRTFWLYRIRPRILFPFKLGKIGLKPYLYSEFFFLEHTGFSENRTAIGLQVPIGGPLSGDIEYMFRPLRRGDHWLEQSVIRVALHLRF